jgi:hypothetical protein
MTETLPVRLFAIRQNTTNPSFMVHQNSPEQSALTVYNNGSDFTVVSQYLNTQLSHVENIASSNEVAANVFFKGWIFKEAVHPSNTTYVLIGTENQTIDLTVLYLSIMFSYVTLLAIMVPKKASDTLRTKIYAVKREK